LLLPKEQKKAYDLKHWDISIRAPAGRKIAFSAEIALLPAPSSRWVVFLVKRLFGASITAADGQAPVWHEDVRYQIADETGDAIAYFIWIPTVAQPRSGVGRGWIIA